MALDHEKLAQNLKGINIFDAMSIFQKLIASESPKAKALLAKIETDYTALKPLGEAVLPFVIKELEANNVLTPALESTIQQVIADLPALMQQGEAIVQDVENAVK